MPQLNAAGMIAAQGLNGALVISPDGQWLFDVVTLAKGGTIQYAVVRRFSASTGALAQCSPFRATSPKQVWLADINAQVPEIYLVRGSPNAECFVLDASAQGPTLIGDIPLGGPVTSVGMTFSGTLALAAAAMARACSSARMLRAQMVTRPTMICGSSIRKAWGCLLMPPIPPRRARCSQTLLAVERAVHSCCVTGRLTWWRRISARLRCPGCDWPTVGR